MSRTVEAIFKNGEVRALERLDLPDETRLKILIEDEPQVVDSVHPPDPLATIYEAAEDAGPADLSVNLDHYLYGLPKR
jgi:predicted DNA-binding antitoxin AbrB/MazE fold protein